MVLGRLANVLNTVARKKSPLPPAVSPNPVNSGLIVVAHDATGALRLLKKVRFIFTVVVPMAILPVAASKQMHSKMLVNKRKGIRLVVPGLQQRVAAALPVWLQYEAVFCALQTIQHTMH